MTRALTLLAVAIFGAAVGDAMVVGGFCAMSWRHGGSADPRCVMHWWGYVEVHEIGTGTDRVSCQYKPEIEKI